MNRLFFALLAWMALPWPASTGAAFRSKRQWYRLKFKCETAPDHMEVLQLRYRIGDKIPESDWPKYNLYN
ncbi:DUF930 domain-containing protein [Mesorhizobium sp. M0204]